MSDLAAAQNLFRNDRQDDLIRFLREYDVTFVVRRQIADGDPRFAESVEADNGFVGWTLDPSKAGLFRSRELVDVWSERIRTGHHRLVLIPVPDSGVARKDE